MKTITKKEKENVVKNGTCIGHDYLTATGSNWDAQLLVYKDSVYFYNQRDNELSFWDNEDFNVQNKPAYMFSEQELINIAKDM